MIEGKERRSSKPLHPKFGSDQHTVCLPLIALQYYIGKWIVAQDDEELKYLESMRDKAQRLGVPLSFIPAAQRQVSSHPLSTIKAKSEGVQIGCEQEVHSYVPCFVTKEEEPNVRCKEALLSPRTGIIDIHSLMQFLESRIVSHEECNVVTHTKAVAIRIIDFLHCATNATTPFVLDPFSSYHTAFLFLLLGQKSDGGYLVDTEDSEGAQCTIEADSVINCAGLYADLVAKMALKDAFPAEYTQYYCKVGLLRQSTLYVSFGHEFDVNCVSLLL